MFCTKCGAAVPEGSKFCTQCGAPTTNITITNKIALENGGKTSRPGQIVDRLLFGETKECCICHKKVSEHGSGGVSLKGGDWLCLECRVKAAMGRLPQYAWSQYTKEAVEERLALCRSFHPTIGIGPGADAQLLKLDEEHALFTIGSMETYKPGTLNMPIVDLFDYSNLADFWPIDEIETKNGVKKGGLARAAVGGALFGGAGAIAGAMTGSEKSVSKVLLTTVGVGISLKNAHLQSIRLLLYKFSPKITDSMINIVYFDEDVARSYARQLLDGLAMIKAHNQAAHEPPSSAATPNSQARPTAAVSVADEIMKFKGLLDAGAITQEEFEAKKKQLLGL